jgi:hypothetical protein
MNNAILDKQIFMDKHITRIVYILLRIGYNKIYILYIKIQIYHTFSCVQRHARSRINVDWRMSVVFLQTADSLRRRKKTTTTTPTD